MAYDELRRDIATFDEVLQRISFSIPKESIIDSQLDLTRGFLSDRDEMPVDTWLAKRNTSFQEFWDAQIVAARITHAIAILKEQPDSTLRKYLKTLCSGPLTQGSEPNQAKDFFYELWLAGVLSECGFEVELCEPDLVVRSNGLTTPVGIACKYPSSEQQVHPHLSKGYSQIGKQSLDGFVAIGLDLMVYKQTFPNGVNFLDFRQGDKQPLSVLQKLVDETTLHLVEARNQLYPSEDPVDGVMLTLTFGGICGDSPGLTLITAVTLQCNNSNPIINDIGRVRDTIRSLNK